MLYQPGDVLPQLTVIRASRVLPGDVFWGVQADNPRKGWLLNAEPHPVPKGAVPAGDGSSEFLQIGSYVGARPDDLVLVQRGVSARAHSEFAADPWDRTHRSTVPDGYNDYY